MTRIVLALLLMWALPAVGQTPEPSDSDECHRVLRAIDLPEYRDSSERWRVEGISRYEGRCHPRDVTAGIALIDRAVRMDNARAAVDMAILAANGGTAEAAAAWRWMATMAVFDYRDATPSERAGLGNLPRWLTDDVAALAWAFEREDVPALLSRVRWLMMRPPYMPKTEWRFVFDVAELAMARESIEAFHLFGIAAIEWAAPADIDENARDLGFHKLHLAAACGYPPAIRKLGEYFAAGRLAGHFEDGVIERVWWLHDQTGEEGDLLARLAPGPRRVFDGVGETFPERDLRTSTQHCSSVLSRR